MKGNSPAIFQPDLTYSLSVMGNGIKYEINVHKVGKIVKFYPDSLTADVQVLSKFNILDNISDYAILVNLPVIIDGAIDTHLTFGDLTGSECLVHFNDTDIDAWYETGESYAPPSLRLHNMSDGFVTLRPHSQTNLFPYDMGGTVLNKGSNVIKLTNDSITLTNGSCTMVMSDDTITITGNVVVSGTITGQTDVIAGNISGKTHKHTCANPGSPTSPPLP